VVTVAVDWLAIRNDYINGGGSYRKLAEKYGVSFGTLRFRAEKENWPELKKEQLHRISIKTAQKTADAIVRKEVKRAERMMGIHDQLLDKLEQAVAELNMAQVTNKRKTKVIEYKNGRRPDKPTKETITENEEILAVSSIVDRKGLQQISVALKALWDISNEHDANKDNDDVEDDGLLAALGANAASLFDDGDDSGMLPKEKEE
jgi:transposase-like protein